jgi:hypothetical protein
MSRRRRLAVLAAALAGCAIVRPTPEMHYYTLSVPGAPAAGLPAPIVVGTVTAEEPYATRRLAHRTSPWALDYWVYHRWAADPRRLVAAAARDYLAQAPTTRDAPPIVLTGRLRRLEAFETAAGRQGALALELRAVQDGRELLVRSYAETEPADPPDPEAVAAALSRGLGRILDRVLRDLDPAVAP